MSNININLSRNSKVYCTTDELSKWLKNQKANTKPFLEAIKKFLEEFNTKFNTNLSFDQVLDIYNGENKLNVRQSIILCKALLDFIQNNSIEVKFKNKSYLLRYNTLASTNAILEYNPLSQEERLTLETLSVTISSFIKKVREYFRMIIADSVTLEHATVDDEFKNIPWIKLISEVIQVNNEEEVNSDITNWSIKISSWLVINLSSSDEQLKNRIFNLNNKHLTNLLNYIYERIDTDKKSWKKHIDIAKFIFDQNYENYLWQLVLNIFEHQKKVRQATIDKINITKLRECIISHPKEKIIDKNNVDIKVSWEKLIFASWVELILKSDKEFASELSNLAWTDVKLLFTFLEDLMKSPDKDITEWTAAKLATEIQKFDNNRNIYQKVISLRKKWSTITEKFLNNNVNITRLRELILSTAIGKAEEDSEDLWEKTNGNIDFSFVDEDTKEEVNIKIKLNWKKDIEWFIYSLNLLINEECNRIWLEGCVDEYMPDSFKTIELDSEFFNNVTKRIKDKNILDMFDIIEQETLEKFLQLWHKKVVWKALEESKRIIIKPGSIEELFDFVWNVWQKQLYKIIRKQGRKWKRKRNNLGDRRDVATITENMFEWIDKLTPDLLSKLSNFKFQKIFSIISRKEVQDLLDEYIEKRNTKS